MAIFLIYDCEIFASPKHLSLIYSILDATKHHSTLISTILVSSKCDATEYFEKRLKSRLGKYQINFMPQLSTDTINKCLIEFLDPIFKSKSQKLKSKKKLQSECIKKIIEKLQTLSQFTLFVPFILKISMKLLSSNNKFTEGLITEAYQELIDSFDIKPFISHPQQFLLTAVVRFSHKSPHVSSFTFKMIYDFYCTSLNQGSDMLPNYDEKSFRN
ncbi:MAG: origin recognition complex subunit 4, partial [Marteilia pararefringens]